MTILAVAFASSDPLTGIRHMLELPFEVRAYVAGTLIAAAAGLVGYFVVLRSQVFTGDAMSHVAFTGALAALAAGVDLRVGLFGACTVFAIAMAVLDRTGRADDVVIGNVFAWVLGLGVFFLTVYTSGAGASGGADTGTSGVNVLFGSIFGLTAGQTTVAAIIAGAVIVVILVIARPLFFASIDGAVAAARGLPVKGLGIAFLVLVGITAGEATQAVGALLILGLLATPAATAQRLTTRPFVCPRRIGGNCSRLDVGGAWNCLRRCEHPTVIRHPRRVHRLIPRGCRDNSPVASQA